MLPIIISLLSIFDLIIGIYAFIIFLDAALNFLFFTNTLNKKTFKLSLIHEKLSQLSRPTLEKIRKHVPIINGIDFSPVIAILLIIFVQKLLRAYGLSI